MASTFSSNLKLEIMATGENENTWGGKTNDNLEKIEQSLAGRLSITLASSDYTLTDVNGGDGSGSTNPANMLLDLTGTLTANVNVIIPNASKFYIVNNQTTQTVAETVGIKTSAGSALDVPNGETLLVWCDGSNGVFTINANVTGTVAQATNALQLGGVVAASYSQLAVKQSWTRPQLFTPVHANLVSNAFTPNANINSHVIIDQSEIGALNITIVSPSGTPTDGQVLLIDIEQHATTPIDVIWGSKYIFPDDSNISLTQTANAIDTFAFQYSSNIDRWIGKGNALNFPRS